MTATALCVLGMHRSGTSATTGALQLLGVDLGDRLAVGHAGINDLGYFEHLEILALHDALLLALGSAWDDVLPLEDGWWDSDLGREYERKLCARLTADFSHSAFWGVKDPRMCRLLPLWLAAFRNLDVDPCFMIVLRHPNEVAASLARRDAMGAEKACQLWLEHTLSAERWSRGHRRAFVTYDDLVDKPVPTLQSLETKLKINWPKSPEAAQSELEAFVSRKYRHHEDGENSAAASGDASRMASEIYRDLIDCGASVTESKIFDDVQGRYEQRIKSLDPGLVEHLRVESKSRARMETKLNTIFRSLAWKIAKRLPGSGLHGL